MVTHDATLHNGNAMRWAYRVFRSERAVNISQEPGRLPPISAPCADTNEPSSSKTTIAANIQSMGFLRTLLTLERARAIQTLFFLQK